MDFAFLSIFALRKRDISLLNKNAKVAQLVEHDLAKVGVASSNLVFRSNPFQTRRDLLLKGNRLSGESTINNGHAQMVELVDTQDLKSCSR